MHPHPFLFLAKNDEGDKQTQRHQRNLHGLVRKDPVSFIEKHDRHRRKQGRQGQAQPEEGRGKSGATNLHHRQARSENQNHRQVERHERADQHSDQIVFLK
jgi:hypothetical protein